VYISSMVRWLDGLERLGVVEEERRSEASVGRRMRQCTDGHAERRRGCRLKVATMSTGESAQRPRCARSVLASLFLYKQAGPKTCLGHARRRRGRDTHGRGFVFRGA